MNISLGWVHTAVFDAELDVVSTEIFSMEKQPCKHTFRRRFRADFCVEVFSAETARIQRPVLPQKTAM